MYAKAAAAAAAVAAAAATATAAAAAAPAAAAATAAAAAAAAVAAAAAAAAANWLPGAGCRSFQIVPNSNLRTLAYPAGPSLRNSSIGINRTLPYDFSTLHLSKTYGLASLSIHVQYLIPFSKI